MNIREKLQKQTGNEAEEPSCKRVKREGNYFDDQVTRTSSAISKPPTPSRAPSVLSFLDREIASNEVEELNSLLAKVLFNLELIYLIFRQ
jgi:hypothetical protein